jgi:hypothetical protein
MAPAPHHSGSLLTWPNLGVVAVGGACLVPVPYVAWASDSKRGPQRWRRL